MINEEEAEYCNTPPLYDFSSIPVNIIYGLFME